MASVAARDRGMLAGRPEEAVWAIIEGPWGPGRVLLGSPMPAWGSIGICPYLHSQLAVRGQRGRRFGRLRYLWHV